MELSKSQWLSLLDLSLKSHLVEITEIYEELFTVEEDMRLFKDDEILGLIMRIGHETTKLNRRAGESMRLLDGDDKDKAATEKGS